MVARQASHAGSWYSQDGVALSTELNQYLAKVQSPAHGIGDKSSSLGPFQLPAAGARAIIAPHAGYAYSGPAAAWAYRSLDLSKIRRVFLLGPSHHFYLTRAALTKCDIYRTPLGNLLIDQKLSKELNESGLFETMSQNVDEDEHSLEMHLPYLYEILSKTFSKESLPLLVPIMIGNTSASTERSLGAVLSQYLTAPENLFVISSDFAHWGNRFRYTYYQPNDGNATHLRAGSFTSAPKSPAIHESIKKTDFECIDAIESGSYDRWKDVLDRTENTVCGRHPIGVFMCAVEEARKTAGKSLGEEWGRFRFIQYDRSSEVKNVKESSVSYASAFATL